MCSHSLCRYKFGEKPVPILLFPHLHISISPSLYITLYPHNSTYPWFNYIHSIPNSSIADNWISDFFPSSRCFKPFPRPVSCWRAFSPQLWPWPRSGSLGTWASKIDQYWSWTQSALHIMVGLGHLGPLACCLNGHDTMFVFTNYLTLGPRESRWRPADPMR